MAIILNNKDFVIETHPFNGNYCLYIYDHYFTTNLTGSFNPQAFEQYCVNDLKAVSYSRLMHSALHEVQFTTRSTLYTVLTIKNMNTLTLDDFIGDWIRQQNQNSCPVLAPGNNPVSNPWALTPNGKAWAYSDEYSLYGGDIPEQAPTGCKHEYKPYYGLRESYQYCTKCDNKKPISD
jgi:hypothetical protein